MTNKDDGSSFMAGIVLGGVAGFVIGTLLAPKSGDETRTLFSERGQELRDKADEIFAAARERMFAAADRGGRQQKRGYPFDDLDFDLDEEDL